MAEAVRVPVCVGVGVGVGGGVCRERRTTECSSEVSVAVVVVARDQ